MTQRQAWYNHPISAPGPSPVTQSPSTALRMNSAPRAAKSLLVRSAITGLPSVARARSETNSRFFAPPRRVGASL